MIAPHRWAFLTRPACQFCGWTCQVESHRLPEILPELEPDLEQLVAGE